MPASSAPPGAEAPQPQAESGAPGSGVHLHDGFYLRGGVGAAVFSSGTVSTPGAPDIDISGVGPAVELALGGTLQNGLVLGGGIYGASYPSPSYSAGGVSVNGGTAIVSSIGPFADWYFDPTKGLHAQLAIGLAALSAAKGTATVSAGGYTGTYPDKDKSGTGVSLMAGVGYEWWVADQLSFGVLARLQYVSGSVKGDGDTQSSDVKAVMPALLASLTYQ